MKLAHLFAVVKDAALDWYRHNAFRHAAALAYYTVASLSPMVVIVVGVAGLLFGNDPATQQYLLDQVSATIGADGARAIAGIVERMNETESGILANGLALAAFVVGFLAVFFELKAGLNAMWGVKARDGQASGGGTGQMIGAMALLAVTGFLLLVSLVVSAALSALSETLNAWQPGLEVLWHGVNFAVSLGVILLLFALLFKYVPDAKIVWGDVWVGAAVTAVLFSLGKSLIGMYLGQSGVASAYGAAGSIVVILLWVYYSTLIVFFGAEITRVYANRFGSLIVPAEGAEPAEPQTPTRREKVHA